ncbi:hypothetical protein FM042_08015 [Aliidiomarina halalkaliphila]|uniref:Uncharacterized protein n=1 Tax=Aliidiomarina halalkaliphila TaxID=2593535 RepID=A0A552X1J5_9GAMM|nr:hypothetical protein [Aliidiomarina halalkaliphila]TRW48918.1 hypothetical protein FM042_08015 [Aliidiomarina halalkaliphila]
MEIIERIYPFYLPNYSDEKFEKALNDIYDAVVDDLGKCSQAEVIRVLDERVEAAFEAALRDWIKRCVQVRELPLSKSSSKQVIAQFKLCVADN